MREITKCGAQGDVLFRRVPAVPKGYLQKSHKGEVIISHSETGHHHVVRGEQVMFFEPEIITEENSLVCYLQMGDMCDFDIEHLRSYDTHETLRLKGNPGDIWEVRRQREHTPEGWRRVQD